MIRISAVQRSYRELFSYLILKPFATVAVGLFTLLLLELFYSGLLLFLLAKSAGGYWQLGCAFTFCIKHWSSEVSAFSLWSCPGSLQERLGNNKLSPGTETVLLTDGKILIWWVFWPFEVFMQFPWGFAVPFSWKLPAALYIFGT